MVVLVALGTNERINAHVQKYRPAHVLRSVETTARGGSSKIFSQTSLPASLSSRLNPGTSICHCLTETARLVSRGARGGGGGFGANEAHGGGFGTNEAHGGGGLALTRRTGGGGGVWR